MVHPKADFTQTQASVKSILLEYLHLKCRHRAPTSGRMTASPSISNPYEFK
jgi:hypothetical protein